LDIRFLPQAINAVKTTLIPVGFLVAMCLISETADAITLLDRRIKATGILKNDQVVAFKFKYRKPSRDARYGRVDGQIKHLDIDKKSLFIGPLGVDWNNKTRFDQLKESELKDGTALKVIGTVTPAGRIHATRFEPGSAAIIDATTVQVLGTISNVQANPDGSLLVRVMGMPILISAQQISPAIVLTRQQDDRRPGQQLKVELFGRPLTIGGEVGVTPRYRNNFNLNPSRNRDRVRLDTEAQLELFYPWNANLAFFLEGQASYEQNLYRGSSSRLGSEIQLRRGQSWVFWGDIAESGINFQVGRQNIRETREWWWDDDLDAVRVSFDRPFIHFEAAVAEQLVPVSTSDNGIDAEKNDVLRILSRFNWQWDARHALDLFMLYQNDHSKRDSIGDRFPDESTDPVDGNLSWLGLRTMNKFSSSDFGEFDLWIDSAWIDGDERMADFDDTDIDGISVVDSLSSKSISGWALDFGLTWELPIAWRPALTFGYAVGTRDFRQTGLQDNNNRFRSVNRFRYYGELLRPELANLHIWTVAATLPILENSSITALYHYYRQVDARPLLRNARLNTDPNGVNTSIGHEWDLIIGLEEWQNLELEFVAALFKAGAAYGPFTGNIAFNAVFKVNYNF